MKYESTKQNSKTIKDINPIMLPIIYEIGLTLFISYIVPPDGIAPYRYLRPLVRTDIPFFSFIQNVFLFNQSHRTYHSSFTYFNIITCCYGCTHTYVCTIFYNYHVMFLFASMTSKLVLAHSWELYSERYLYE